MPSPNTLPADHIRIRIHAAGVNRADLFQREGKYPTPAGASPIPGLEVAGEVVHTGTMVTNFAVGDRICALVNGGGFATEVTAPAAHSFILPDAMPYEEAACLPEALFTVQMAVFERGCFQSGQNLFLHGGASGIGTIAIQCAIAMGAQQVIATTSNAAKTRHVEQLGGLAINHTQQNIAQAVKEATNDIGAHTLLDMVGGSQIEQLFSCAAPRAHIVTIVLLGGNALTGKLTNMFTKQLHWHCALLRPTADAQKDAMATAIRKNFWPKVCKGTISPVIDRIFALQDADNALDYMAKGTHIGKIVLRTRP